MTNLRSVNLNLLPILQALLDHQNVTKASKSLNMSQSAVSDALANLRHVFQDELLVKNGRAMLLTDFSRKLIPGIEEALSNIRQVLGTPQLTVADIKKEFVIATADSVVMTVGPKLALAVQKLAPQVTIRFIELGASAMTSFQSGKVDLVIAPGTLFRDISTHLKTLLYTEEFVCIMRKGHPLGKKPLTKKSYSQAVHATYSPEQNSRQTVENQLMQSAKLQQFESIKVSDFTLLPYFVETSDSIAMIPNNVAKRFQKHSNIQIKKLPFQNTKVPMYLVWSELKHKESTHHWFRQIFTQISFE